MRPLRLVDYIRGHLRPVGEQRLHRVCARCRLRSDPRELLEERMMRVLGEIQGRTSSRINAGSNSHGAACSIHATNAFSVIQAESLCSPAPNVIHLASPMRRNSIPSRSARRHPECAVLVARVPPPCARRHGMSTLVCWHSGVPPCGMLCRSLEEQTSYG